MAKDLDQFIGVEYRQRFSMTAGDGNTDGIYGVERNRFLERVVKTLFGERYSGYTLLKVNLENGSFSTPVRGETIYAVKDGRVIERVDLPLFAIGKLDKRVERGVLDTEQHHLPS